jgi:hypothetical protein
VICAHLTFCSLFPVIRSNEHYRLPIGDCEVGLAVSDYQLPLAPLPDELPPSKESLDEPPLS